MRKRNGVKEREDRAGIYAQRGFVGLVRLAGVTFAQTLPTDRAEGRYLYS